MLPFACILLINTVKVHIMKEKPTLWSMSMTMLHRSQEVQIALRFPRLKAHEEEIKVSFGADQSKWQCNCMFAGHQSSMKCMDKNKATACIRQLVHNYANTYTALAFEIQVIQGTRQSYIKGRTEYIMYLLSCLSTIN